MIHQYIPTRTFVRTEVEHSKQLTQCPLVVVRNVTIFCEIYLLVFLLLFCRTTKAQEREEVGEIVNKLKQAVDRAPDSIDAYLSLGRAYLALSAMEEAEATFLHALELDSRYAEVYYWLGRTRYLQEKYEESRETFQTAISIFPDWSEGYAELGLSYFRLHQHEAAEAAYLKALSLYSNHRYEFLERVLLSPLPLNENESQEWIAKVTPLSQADIYYYLSLTFFERGLLDEASEYCEKAILIEPFAEAYFQLGLVFVRKEQLAKAAEAFRQAISQKPAMTQAHYQLALLYSKQKRATEAKKQMEIFQKLNEEAKQFHKHREALVRSMDKASAFANLGLLCLNEQKYEESAREYQKAIWHEPNFAEAYNGLGHAYALLGQFEEAIQAQEKAIKLEPNMAEAYAGLGFTYLKQAELSQSEDDYRLALEAYRKATELKPDFPEALRIQGNIALKLDDTETVHYQDADRPLLQEAEKAFEALLSVQEKKSGESSKLALEQSEGINLAPIHLALGTIYLRQEDFPKAVSHYQRALKYEANSVSAYYNMGFIAAKVGRLDKAIEFYNEVLKRESDMTEVHYLLGKIYAEQKKYVQAEKSYQRTLEIEPTASYAYERLAHLYGVTLTQALSHSEREQRLDKALQFAKKAVELQPDSADYLNTLSWLYYLRRDYTQAEQAIQKALSLQPDNSIYKEGLEVIRKARLDENEQ